MKANRVSSRYEDLISLKQSRKTFRLSAVHNTLVASSDEFCYPAFSRGKIRGLNALKSKITSPLSRQVLLGFVLWPQIRK